MSGNAFVRMLGKEYFNNIKKLYDIYFKLV